VFCICGCSSTAVRIRSLALDDQATQSPDRFIVAAVDNATAPFMAHAGSTPRGYDGVTVYGPTPQALRIMRTVADDYGLHQVSAWPIEPLHMQCALMKIPDGADRTALLDKLSKDGRITLAQPLQAFATRTGAYNDPYVDLQRGFQQMDVAGAHPWSLGEGVTIAVIDTGADTRHPDLLGAIAAAVNFVDSDSDQFRRDRHGTEMAGVIAAVANNREGIVGVAPAAHLLIFKACWQARADADAASCNSFTLARALAAALTAHAQIVNLSLTGPADPLLNDLIQEGVRRGVLFVGAAPSGAAATEGLLHQPGIIEVASVESRREIGPRLYAPGHEILTLLPGGHYDFASGDSIATAQVTGVVALLLAKRHSLSATAAYELLRDTSTHWAATTEATPAAGAAAAATERVDACAAVVALVGQGTCADSREAQHPETEHPDPRVALH
jgi:hypothetical protein